MAKWGNWTPTVIKVKDENQLPCLKINCFQISNEMAEVTSQSEIRAAFDLKVA